MIQMQSKLEVADNSGAKVVKCIKVLGGSKKMIAKMGDIIVVSVQQALPGGKVKKGKLRKPLLLELLTQTEEDGSYIRFDENSAVILNNSNEPVGTRIFGPVARELRAKNFTKICSLAPEVL